LPETTQAPILVTGAHRSGTTWVGKMLTVGGEAAYISEPLNVWHRPGVFLSPVPFWYFCISTENESEYLKDLRNTLAYRYHLGAEISSLRSIKDIGRMGRDTWIFLQGRLRQQRPLIKDPFALFAAPWFADRLGCQVVITVRHPAAFASSLKRLNWLFDFNHFLAQPVLMRNFLEPYREEIEVLARAPGDCINNACLLWKIIYSVARDFTQSIPHLNIVRHEDLSLDPLAGFQALYAELDLTFNDSAIKGIQKSSSIENPGELSRKKTHSVRLDSKTNLNNWKKRLSPEEVRQVRSLTDEVAAYYYPNFNWD
jgi:hypothetical protein